MTMPNQSKPNSKAQSQPYVYVSGVESSGTGAGIKVSIRFAVLIQVLMMAAGAGATYTATRAAIDSDRQKIEDQSHNIQTLQISMVLVQQTLASLTTAIDYMSKELRSTQDRLWNDTQKH